MKTIFIEARYKKKITLPNSVTGKLPKKIGLFTTVQFIGSIDNIKTQLDKAGITVKLFKLNHAKYKGQILGCNIQKFKGVDAFLYIGDGMFHPITLAIKNSLPVFIFNPFSRKFFQLDKPDIKKYQNRQKVGLKKFYMSKNIGILVSTKTGQNKLKQAIELKKKIIKNSYILISNDIDFQSLENFPFIDCFVNTACPRIGYDDEKRLPKPVINLEDLTSLVVV